ncbi:MAG: hypothetical protein ABI670_17770 [Chloroflexota bacterium]
MPDLIQVVLALSGGVLGYGDVLWMLAIAVCCLLSLSASKLVGQYTTAGARRWPMVLLWAVMLASLCFGLADWLGVPDVDDSTTPWHVTIMLWVLASLPLALAFLRAWPRHRLLALLCGGVGLSLFAAMVGTSLRLWEHGVTGTAALLYAAPLPLGSVLLAWTLTSGRRRYALYIAAWFVVLATLGLRLYLYEMSTLMYQVEQYSAVPSSSPEHARLLVLAGQATQAEVWISVLYFAVALALLIIPIHSLLLSPLSCLSRSLAGNIITRVGRGARTDTDTPSRLEPHRGFRMSIGLLILPVLLMLPGGALLQQGSAGELDFTWLWSLAPLAMYFLLFPAARLLASSSGRRGRYLAIALALALAGAMMHYGGLLNAPGMLAAAVVMFVPWVVVGFGAGFALSMFKRGYRTRALWSLAIAGIFVIQQAAAIGGRASILDYPYQGTGLSVLVPLVGGFLLASAAAAGDEQRALYIATGLLFAGSIGLGAYLNLMEGITYAFVAPDQMFGPYAGIRVAQATSEAIISTLVYVAGSLAMLGLPFIMDPASPAGPIPGHALTFRRC